MRGRGWRGGWVSRPGLPPSGQHSPFYILSSSPSLFFPCGLMTGTAAKQRQSLHFCLAPPSLEQPQSPGPLPMGFLELGLVPCQRTTACMLGSFLVRWTRRDLHDWSKEFQQGLSGAARPPARVREISEPQDQGGWVICSKVRVLIEAQRIAPDGGNIWCSRSSR